MGSVPPVDSIAISDQKTPVLIWTEATFEIGMLSSLLPNSRDLVRITRCGLTTSLVGKKKFPCVQREALKVSAGDESIELSGEAVIASCVFDLCGDSRPRLSAERKLRCASAALSHPFQCAFFPNPDISNDQDRQEDQHLQQSKKAKSFELHSPGKQKDRFHIKDHEQDRDDVVADGVAPAGVVNGVDATLVGHKLGLAGIVGPYQLGQKQR